MNKFVYVGVDVYVLDPPCTSPTLVSHGRGSNHQPPASQANAQPLHDPAPVSVSGPLAKHGITTEYLSTSGALRNLHNSRSVYTLPEQTQLVSMAYYLSAGAFSATSVYGFSVKAHF